MSMAAAAKEKMALEVRGGCSGRCCCWVVVCVCWVAWVWDCWVGSDAVDGELEWLRTKGGGTGASSTCCGSAWWSWSSSCPSGWGWSGAAAAGRLSREGGGGGDGPGSAAAAAVVVVVVVVVVVDGGLGRDSGGREMAAI